MKFQKICASVALPALAILLATSAAFPSYADTLIDNVEGITFDANGRMERFNGLLIGDDGRVTQILKRGDKRPTNVDFKSDARGKILMPSFIDPDVRMMPLGLALFGIPEGSSERTNTAPRPEDRDVAFLEAQKYLLEHGITTIADLGTTIEDWQTYRRAGDAGQLMVRIVGYANSLENMVLIAGPRPTPWLYQDRLRLNGLLLTLDGPVAKNAAVLEAPYADSSITIPRFLISDIQLRNAISRAAIDGFQVVIEAHGDKAIASVNSALDELVDTYTGERRWRISGVDITSPTEITRLAKHGVSATIKPRQTIAAQSRIEANLGTRASSPAPWKSLSDAGIRLNISSGIEQGQNLTSVLAPNPFDAIATAITRESVNTPTAGGWHSEERLSRETAIAATTVHAAYALQGEGRLGRIAQGQRADFILIDQDPTLVSNADLRNIRVLQTWINGQLVYDSSRPPTPKAQAPRANNSEINTPAPATNSAPAYGPPAGR